MTKKYNLSQLEYVGNFEHKKSVLFDNNDFDSDTKLQILLMEPGQLIAPHHHNVRTEVFMVVEGECEIKINGEVCVSKKGDIALCKPGDIHQMQNLNQGAQSKVMVIRTNDPGNSDMYWEVK